MKKMTIFKDWINMFHKRIHLNLNKNIQLSLVVNLTYHFLSILDIENQLRMLLVKSEKDIEFSRWD